MAASPIRHPIPSDLLHAVVGRRVPPGGRWHTLPALQEELIAELHEFDPERAAAIYRARIGLRAKYGNTALLISLQQYVRHRRKEVEFERAVREGDTEQLQIPGTSPPS